MTQLILLPAIGPRVKRCPKCHVVKDATEFPRREPGRQSPSAYCKPCQRVYSKAHYQRNRGKHNLRRAEHAREYRVRNQHFIARILTGAFCIDCGEDDPIVLEFDHVMSTKRYNVSSMTYRGVSVASIVAEIAKCVIRCANCHRRKTATMYWKGSPRLRAKEDLVGR
jgi:hypothetical protein